MNIERQPINIDIVLTYEAERYFIYCTPARKMTSKFFPILLLWKLQPEKITQIKLEYFSIKNPLVTLFHGKIKYS